MSDYPEYSLFAVIKDGYVIDGGFGGKDGIIYSIMPPNTKTYKNEDGYEFMLMTEENKFVSIGTHINDL